MYVVCVTNREREEKQTRLYLDVQAKLSAGRATLWYDMQRHLSNVMNSCRVEALKQEQFMQLYAIVTEVRPGLCDSQWSFES